MDQLFWSQGKMRLKELGITWKHLDGKWKILSIFPEVCSIQNFTPPYLKAFRRVLSPELLLCGQGLKNNNWLVPNVHSCQEGKTVCVSYGISRTWTVVLEAGVKIWVMARTCLSVHCIYQSIYPQGWGRAGNSSVTGRISSWWTLQGILSFWYRETWGKECVTC